MIALSDTQAVACLAFTDDSNVLVSAAGDTTAHAWLLPDVLDAASAQNGSMPHLTPLHSWCAPDFPAVTCFRPQSDEQLPVHNS